MPIQISNTQLDQAEAASRAIMLAYESDDEDDCELCLKPEHIRQQIEKFPEGQFIALLDGKVVGAAATMRLNEPPAQPAKKWVEAIGDMGIDKHDPQGDWLYGVEVGVDAAYQGKGVGTALYHARFNLVKKLNLRGWYAGGMLSGYGDYTHLSPSDYADNVLSGEIIDPTVSMQLNRGFEAHGVIEDYLEGEDDYDRHAMLLIWHNPTYEEKS